MSGFAFGVENSYNKKIKTLLVKIIKPLVISSKSFKGVPKAKTTSGLMLKFGVFRSLQITVHSL